MTNIGQKSTRQIMAAQGSIFALAAFALLFAPARFADILGLTTTDSVTWSLRITGIVLIPLVYTLFVVRGSLPNHVVRAFAILMAAISLALGVVTLLAPGPTPIGRGVFALVGFGFAFAYAWAFWRDAQNRDTPSPRGRKAA
jgi:hypothetical protein